MPGPFESAAGKLRITDPLHADNFVDVPILVRGLFNLPQDRGQDTLIQFSNKLYRQHEIHRVDGGLDVNKDPMYIDVCRIRKWAAKDRHDLCQEWTYKWAPLSDDEDQIPMHFEMGDAFQITNPDQKENWVSIRQAVQCHFHCSQEQGQDYKMYPIVPSEDDEVWFTGELFDPGPPYMLDPFQDIVNVHWHREKKHDQDPAAPIHHPPPPPLTGFIAFPSGYSGFPGTQANANYQGVSVHGVVLGDAHGSTMAVAMLEGGGAIVTFVDDVGDIFGYS